MPIRYNSFYRIIHEMPAHHYLLLKKILPFLQLVVSNSEKNKMTLKNLIMCMLPPIFGQEMMNDMQIASINGTVLSLLVHNTDLWFGVSSSFLFFNFSFYFIFSFLLFL